jgi:hypothetical protein
MTETANGTRRPIRIILGGDGAIGAVSPDGLTLTIKYRAPGGGILTTTLTRAAPFTDAAIRLALTDIARHAQRMEVGQRNRTRRWVGEYGELFCHLMLGPPTWWKPKLRLERDGTVMVGWLRAAIAVRYQQPVWLR